MDNKSGLEGFEDSLMDKSTFFFADGGLLESTNIEWLQELFDIITHLFGQVVMRNNLENTVAMWCQPGSIACIQHTPAYGRRMDVKGASL